ncbi:MAG: phospho-sugar mutase [Eubacteriaceae bacterium]|nr:phospho-sugar mutase [Eubacteriaceae bacterium]
MKKCIKEYKRWLRNTDPGDDLFDGLLMMEDKEDDIYEAFYKDLKFGTSGLRGVMMPGTNRMNVPVVRRATQGLSDYMNIYYKNPSAVISYDSRNNSKKYADAAAEVLAANDIKTYVFNEIMPVSALSFAIRELSCDMGIMITASHNPKEYNGYKVYDSEGCQIRSRVAEGIFEEIKKVDIFGDVRNGRGKGLIAAVPEKISHDFVEEAYKVSPGEDRDLSDLKLVYTPLNGTGQKPITELLSKAGLKNIHVVEEQKMPDGDFPTCPSPNPEYSEIYGLAERLCDDTDSDLIIATDPDCDRLGIAVKKGNGYKNLSGNQIAVLLFDYICRAKEIPEQAVAVRSIVSTPQIDKIAEENGIGIETCLIGFKYIGEKIGRLRDRFIFGFEEGNGYLAGDFVRDKDGVSTALLACRMAAYHKERGRTLLQALEEISEEYGYYKEKVLSFTFDGSRGVKKMQKIMDSIRKHSHEDIFGKKATTIIDYLTGEQYIIGDSSKCEMAAGTRPTGLPKENILEFVLNDESRIIIRPSGTEPKIKVYLFACSRQKATAKTIINDNAEKVKALWGK